MVVTVSLEALNGLGKHQPTLSIGTLDRYQKVSVPASFEANRADPSERICYCDTLYPYLALLKGFGLNFAKGSYTGPTSSPPNLPTWLLSHYLDHL